MKTESFHSVLDRQTKYNQFITSQVFNSYKLRGRDQNKKAQTTLSPSDDKKLSNNFSTSQSYLNAMKALQDKIKQLEQENQNLQSIVLSQDVKEKVIDQKQKDNSNHLRSNDSQNFIKELEQKLAQQEIATKQMKDDYETKLQQLQYNLLNIASQSDKKYREQQEEIQNLTEQLDIQNDNNQNYRIKINQHNSALQLEKQNFSNLQGMLEKEKNETKFLLEKNEKLQQESMKLKEELFELHSYMDWYTNEFNEQTIKQLQNENERQKQTITDLNKQLDQLKEQYDSLNFNFEQKKQELQRSEIKRVKKLSETNIKIDYLKQQLINLSSNSLINTQSPRVVKKSNKNIKPMSQHEMLIKAQKIRDMRVITNESTKKLQSDKFLTQQNSQINYINQHQSLKVSQGNDSQSSVLSRLIVKTQEENLASSLKKQDIKQIVYTDEMNQTDYQNEEKLQKYEEASQRIKFLEEILESLNLKYDDIENQISQDNDLKTKKEKRSNLLEIIEQMQNVNKELNDLLTIQKLASKQ